MSTWYNSKNNTIPMFYEQKMVNEIDTAKFADVGCRVTFDPPVSIKVNKYLNWLILECDTSFESLAQALLISTQKK